MARAVCVTLFLALSITWTAAYPKECATGPSYWCQSFQNAQDCGALRHCTDTVWRYDEDRTNLDSAIPCQWCQKILENTHQGILNLEADEDAIQSTLINACKLLPLTDVSLKCTSVMESYGTSVLALMKHKRYNTLCRLMNICSGEESQAKEETKTLPADEQDKMLCNVIVQATHELTTVQQKTREEVQLFLLADCQKLSDPELVSKCETLIQRHGDAIYGHVASKVELSKICDYLGDATGRPVIQAEPSVHCQVCQAVLSNAKSMLGNQQEDEVLSYIDEQLCSRLTGSAKKACQAKILNNGKALIDDMQSGNTLMLSCTNFGLCTDQIMTDKTSIERTEMKSFISKNFCKKLGSFAGACQALVDGDATMVLQGLVNDVNGNELCHMFGLCPKTSELLTVPNLNDDPNKCKRCVKDFTRRKHIAERLVNRSAEFLHHLCGQLPNQDDCNKAIDDSFNELVTFIRSMDPRGICVQLHMCDANTYETSTISEEENVLQEESLGYIKSDLCSKLGPLASLCSQIVETEGISALKWVGERMDPHRVCEVLDICPSENAFDQCNDKCQCCMNKVDVYQLKLSKFLKTIVASTRTMCEYVPARDVCVDLADLFESNVNNAMKRLDSRKVCQLLTFCPASQDGSNTPSECDTCQTELKTRQKLFYTLVKEMESGLSNGCTDDQCRSSIRLSQTKALKQIEELNVNQICQHIGYCAISSSFEPSAIQLRLRTLLRHQTLTLDQRLAAHDICSQYGALSNMCVHILALVETHRYGQIYKALLTGDTKLIDDDLRQQLQTKPGSSICDACKNAVKSEKDFWVNSLEVAHTALLQSCERCPKKDECRAYYDRRFQQMESYINSIDENLYCQALHLCSTQSNTECHQCTAYFNDRKENLEQGLNRLIPYIKDVCQRFNLKQCQQVLQTMEDALLPTIKQLQTQEICSQMGFCSSTTTTTSDMSFDYYRKSIEDELEEKICTSLGPFSSLCTQVLHGNRKQVETVKINDNIRDLLNVGEDKKSVNLLSALNQEECSRDRCQCCVDRVEKKKDCLKSMANQVFGVLIKSCDYCPSKDQCRGYWKSEQDQCISSIKSIDSKGICTKLGFCNSTSDEAEILVVPSAEEEKHDVDQVHDSNATCILCEYFMHILSNYITEKSTEKEIEQSLEKICKQMPKSLIGQCEELVNNYAPVIVATLVQQFDPTTVCRRLNLCTKEMKVNLPHLTKANSMACGVCDYVTTYVHFALKRDSSEKSLRTALKGACTHLSSEQKSHCETIVQLFGPHMRKLQSGLGTNFCQQLTMCQTPMTPLKPALHLSDLPKTDSHSSEESDDVKTIITNNLDDTPQCMLCRYVVTYLDAVLKTNKSEAAVEAALARVCSILPSKERPRCYEFVKTYGATLADLISKYAEPELVCRYLGMCQALIKGEGQDNLPKPITYSNHKYVRIPPV